MNLAIDTLVRDGIDQVKVQLLSKSLGVSRSSFYWFFESIQDLQDQLLDCWLRKNTGPIIERAMRPAPTINRAICNVFECWLDRVSFDPDLDVAVRYWGRHEPRIRSVLDEADKQRIDALKRMFARYGYADEEAYTRARVLYYAQIGHYTLGVTEDVATRIFHAPTYFFTYTGVPLSADDLAALEHLAAKHGVAFTPPGSK
ncbi:MAG: TetR/AcrR family transcriptional regulator [Rhizobiaceae bacterium]